MKPLLLNAGFYTSVERLQDVIVRDVRGPLTLLWASAVVVLLVGVANVASLAVARLRTRLSELGTRLALGARRSDILRQFVVEGLLVAAGAMGAGLLLASSLLLSFPAPMLAGRDTPQIDMPVIAITAAVAALAGIVIACAAAFPLLTLTPGVLLQHGARTGTGGRAVRVTRRTLVVGQVACAFVLLVGAGLLDQPAEFVRRRHRDPDRWRDYRRYEPSGQRYTTPDDARAFVSRSLTTIREPSWRERRRCYDSRAAQRQLPERHHRRRRVCAGTWRGSRERNTRRCDAWLLRSGGHTVIAGRYFDESDNHPDSTALIIDEALARKFWPGSDPVGRRMFGRTTLDRSQPLTRNTLVDRRRRRPVREAAGSRRQGANDGAFYLPYVVTAPREFG